MIYKIFEIKNYPHIDGRAILDTKEKQGFGLDDYVSFSDTELKSILSIIYAIYLHNPEVRETQNEIKGFLTEQNPFFNISRDFGRLLLENLEGSKLEWYQELLKAKYKLDGIFHNQELIYFVNEALISQMPIRQWEYGRFFLQQLFPILVDKFKWYNSKDHIYRSIENDENPLLKIAGMFKKSQTTLNAYENFTLIFVLKQQLLKEKITMGDYMVISQIAQHRILQLHSRRLVLKRSFNSVIKIGWSLNKGRGGPRI